MIEALIEAYEFGRIVVNGRAYTSDLIIFPDRVEAGWQRKEGHALRREDVSAVVRVGNKGKEKLEVLIVGTGKYGVLKVLPEAREFAETEGVELIAEPTARACETYNRLSKSKKVAAALHLTC